MLCNLQSHVESQAGHFPKGISLSAAPGTYAVQNKATVNHSMFIIFLIFFLMMYGNRSIADNTRQPLRADGEG